MKNRGIRWIQIACIFVCCVALNLGGRYLSDSLQLPVWLDMVGTCVACYFLGLWGGLLAAVLNNVLFAVWSGQAMVYAITGVVCAVVMYLCIKKGCMERISLAMFMSFWIGLSSVVVSTPLNLIFYHGYSGNIWGDALYEMMKWYGVSDPIAALLGEIVVEVLDKQLCILLSFLIVHFFRLLGRRENADRAQRKSVAAILLLALLSSACLPMQGYAHDGEIGSQEEYSSRIYNNQNGLMSSEANVISETDDGYLWIGSYAGLTRYDGTSFEFINEGGIVNVTDMLSDSEGRLWIGTNDRGIARYQDGEFTYFKTEDGLPANSIRSFCEGGDGEIYVATTDRICVFEPGDEIRILNEDVFYMQSITMHDGMLVCAGNDGCIYVLKGGELIATYQKDTDATFFNCVRSTGEGLFGGTASDVLYRIEIAGGKVKLGDEITLPIQNIHYIEENQSGQIWICGDNGFGYYSGGAFRAWDVPGFSTSMECVHEDYQGNIWLASSRYGVLCLSQTPFINLFSTGGIDPAVCNAALPYNGGWLAGTDSGLVQISRSGKEEESELTLLLAEDRVRSLLQDSEGNLWICTYSEHGLVEKTAAGEIRCYTTADCPLMPSDRIRCATELSGGGIAVGTADGIFYIRDGEVTGAITQEDGLVNSQILSIIEGEDGVLYAGSDGAGLFLIRDGRIVDNLSTKTGLPSDVILRIVPSKYGLLLVTSNSLCLVDDNEVKTLTSFPYYNNYDILLEEETAYVLSSAGVFVVNLEELCKNAEMTYSLYDARHGLQCAITANSWNYIGADNALYLCSNEGIVKFLTRRSKDISYRFGLKSVVCDGEEIPLAANEGVIPGTAKDITINASLRSYALTDVKVRFYLDGQGEEQKLQSYSQLQPLRIINPSSGEYRVHFEVYDAYDGKLIEEQVYRLKKEQQMWEKSWYRLYLGFMALEIVCYIIWTFVLVLDDRRKRQMEMERKQRQLQELILSQTVFSLAKTVDAKDNYTRGHSARVAEYARMIAERMGKSEEEQAQIYRAGMLHDIGKIRVPEEIINKPGKLTPEEFALIKLHPTTGYHILKGIPADSSLSEGARFHHERYDGNGYPNGLAGQQIPEIARIIGVADAYDAMASNRSYRNALPQETIRKEIEHGKGSQFDPEIADIMLAIMDEDDEYKMREMAMGRKRILVVDDDPDNIRLVREALEDVGLYDLFAAGSGEEAIGLLKGEEAFDLVLLDYRMSEMDGDETAQQIRKFSEIPIVLMSDDRHSLQMELFEKIGIADFITKPFMPAALKEILHAVLVQ